MERYTFEEIKNLQMDDLFWVRGQEFFVNATPIYFSESNFYGDYSEKIGWTGISKTTNHCMRFQITNTRDKNSATDPIIYKTPAYQTILGSSNIQIPL